MPTSRSTAFTVKLNSLTRRDLHALLNAVATRAYKTGYKDASIGLEECPEKVAVAEKHLWKIK